MSESDIQVWCVYPTTTRPFCIRSHAGEFDAAPMWDAFDQVVEVEPVSASDSTITPLPCTSYGMLDSVVRQVEDWLAEESAVRRICSPGNLGRELAAVITARKSIVDATAIRVAQSWRESDGGPSRTGAALLARAGAFESDALETAAVESGAIETGGIETGGIETGALETGALETGAPAAEPMIEFAAVNLPDGITNLRRR